MSSVITTSGGNIAIAIVSVITGGVIVIVASTLMRLIYKCYKLHLLRKYDVLRQAAQPALPLAVGASASAVVAPGMNAGGVSLTVTSGSKFISSTYDVVKDRPVRFSSLQLQEFTGGYVKKLGSGGFGAVYMGQIPLPDCGSLAVAVKVLHSGMGRRAEEQFMAEIGTIGRTSHVNLVRLYGFCFDADVKALVYEFMPNGSLEGHLFLDAGGGGVPPLMFDTLYDIAAGTAKAIRYLHGQCERRIIHCDIKPGNVLLDETFRPKVADFGLARLCDRERTHLTMTGGGRGTPGYAAPELWMAAPATHKCDVYSYGMMLFELLGRRRNYVEVPEDSSQQWYPRWVWQRLDQSDTDTVVARALANSKVSNKDGCKKVERMCAVALWCVQYRPEDRPSMYAVVRMLEGDEEVTVPAVSPFAHLEAEPLLQSVSQTTTTTTTTTCDSDDLA